MAFSTGTAIIEDENTTLNTVSAASAGTLANDAVDSETAKKTTLSSLAAFTSLFITFQVGTTTAAGASIAVYRRDMNGGGSFDVNVPSANNRSVLVGSFLVPAAVSINTDIKLKLSAAPIDGDCEFYIGNYIGQTISTGWLLQSDAKSYAAAA